MRCPKCQKFIPSTARQCPGCGIEIISGASPNYGQDFVRQSDAAADPSPFADEETRGTTAKNTGAAGFGAKLKSLFGFGK